MVLKLTNHKTGSALTPRSLKASLNYDARILLQTNFSQAFRWYIGCECTMRIDTVTYVNWKHRSRWTVRKFIALVAKTTTWPRKSLVFREVQIYDFRNVLARLASVCRNETVKRCGKKLEEFGLSIVISTTFKIGCGGENISKLLNKIISGVLKQLHLPEWKF